MEKLNVITRVHEPTDWVSSLVYSRKSNGKIRICLDPKDLNKAIKRPHYATKTLEEITHHLGGAQVFSKLDARSGYWSVHLDHASSILTTFNSPFGRYRFCRLPFGLNLSQDVFQERMDRILEYCPGTIGIADDVGVFGNTEQEHDDNLRHLMETAGKHGLVFNEEKCAIKTSSLTFFGLRFDKDGVHPDPARILAIKQITSPENPQALREFLGIATYMSPFTKDLAHHATPLRELLKKDVDYQWTASHEQAFKNVKERICSEATLAYYSPKDKTTVQVDASGLGLGATLLQNGKPIAFASKTLSPAEKRYANIEREMLAVVFGCERFHNYVYGTRFTIQSDHKPLEMISRKNLYAAPTRLQRMLLRVQQYDFDITYLPGKDVLLADALSRQPLDDDDHMELDIQIMPVQFSIKKIDELREATDADPIFDTLKSRIINGWPKDHRHVEKHLRPYWSFRDELTIHDGLVLKGQQILIPSNARLPILQTLHVPHLGIVNTMALARAHVHWPGIGQDITRTVASCRACQENQPRQRKEPLMPIDPPSRPWQNVGTDLFYYKEKTYLIICDYYSKFPFIYLMPNPVTSRAIIERLKTLFSEHGIPDKLISDNGGHYSSEAFKTFILQWDFIHLTSSPYHPQCNGFAERMIQTVKDRMKKSTDVPKALLLLRATPVRGSDKSPAELLFNRNISTPLPSVYDTHQPHVDLLERNSEVAKGYHDTPNPKPLPPLAEDSNVLYRDPITRTWKLATITQCGPQPRSYNLRTATGTHIRRNRRDIRPVPPDTLPGTQHVTHAEHPLDTPPVLRRSTRIRHPPDRLGIAS